MYLSILLLLIDQYGEVDDELPSEIYSDDTGIMRAARCITQKYDQKLTQEYLANISGYSPNYFSKRFRETTGIGAHEYLLLIRLKNAALLLETTDRSVLDIALTVGFSDSNYFKDAFKRQYGLSPTAYRKKL